jgi:formylglycine-generating enzyme required for sulfatase activity
MGKAISTFMQKLKANGNNEGFFWYAGHGVEIDGENYLLPVDIGDEEDAARYSSTRLNDLLSQFERIAGNRVNVVIIDACRNNPFTRTPTGTRGASRSRGLVVVDHPPQDMFLMYSTAPGDTAADGVNKRNSPFAEAFLKHAGRQEPLVLMVTRVVDETRQLTNGQQRPYQGGSFSIPDYTLAAGGIVPPSPAPRPTPPQPEPPATERPVIGAMIPVKGGTFTMGSPASELSREDDEAQHQVTVSGFSIGKYEVTQREYQALMGTNPSSFKGDNLPVENVSWFDAVRYCNARSQQEGLAPAYTINKETVTWNRSANGYRLPTEAEWEYACRAGTVTAYNTGNAITASQARYNTNTVTMPGSFAPNAWGLYDMHGNVREWCWDWYNRLYVGYYNSESKTDPQGRSFGENRIVRGGSWKDAGLYLRSAIRTSTTPSSLSNTVGFRVVRSGL